MSDCELHYESDEYHEDSFQDLHRDDSLPDLVLSSSLTRESDLDLTSHLLEPPTDLDSEYFNTDQVTTSVRATDGGIRVTYTDTEKPYVTQRISSCADRYRNYLNLTVPSDEESGDETMQEEFKSLSPETQTLHRESWASELAELDKEIVGLEEQIRRKVREAAQLKQKLGLTAWREFSQDLREGMKKLKESPTYQTVEAELSSLAIKKVSVKTSESLSSAQRKLTQKLQDIGVVDQPKIYRNDDIEPVIAPSKCGDN